MSGLPNGARILVAPAAFAGQFDIRDLLEVLEHDAARGSEAALQAIMRTLPALEEYERRLGRLGFDPEKMRFRYHLPYVLTCQQCGQRFGALDGSAQRHVEGTQHTRGFLAKAVWPWQMPPSENGASHGEHPAAGHIIVAP